MTLTADVLVAGGGIVGCAVALEAARAGLRVVVAEPGVVGGGATGAAMGHLVVLDDDPYELALCRLSLELWQEFLDAPGVEHAPTGTLWVAADEEEKAAALEKRERLAAAGLAADWLDGRALAEAEPLLRPGLAGALRVPGDSVVYPPGAALTFLTEAQALGAKLVRAAVRWAGDRFALSDGARADAGAVVLACGTDTRALAPGLPVVPRKGHLVITDRYPGLVHHQLVELGYVKSAKATSGGASVAMNVQPRPTGQLLIGSSRQFTGDGDVDLGIVERMLARAFEYLPGLKRLHAIRVWWGFRPAPSDGRPFLGGLPGRERVWLATGHEGLGITTSLASARLVVDQILGRPSPIDATPFAPSRALPC